MNAPAQSRAPAAAPRAQAVKPAIIRRRRAVVARRLHSGDPALASRLDWTTLDDAPGWLTLSEADLSRFAMQVGALTHAPSLRIWIDAPRVAAVKAAIGPRFLQALLAQPEAQVPLPRALSQGPEIGAADRVAPALRESGLGVLMASLPPGTLRDAVMALWKPVKPVAIADELARVQVSRARSLVISLQSAAPAEGGAPKVKRGEPA